MRVGRHGFGAHLRAAVRDGGRGLLLALSALVVCIPLFVGSVVSLAYLALGVGVVLAPPMLLAVRRHAERQRRRALDWSGVRIRAPYRPRPQVPESGWARRRALCTWLLTDPATWRDLLWVLANVPVGLVLGLLPACLLLNGLEGAVAVPLAIGFPHVAYWWIEIVLGALTLAAAPYATPALLRAHAVFSASLLGPSGRDLDARVGHLTESRSQVLDASAAELRRIERDLHDGAQARLAALGLNIGLAEQLVRDKPDAAINLLVEARESSGQALADLRGLVRGIHPPVLAERGLEGAVQALALSLPMPVEVHVELEAELSDPAQSAVYFAIAEALANVIKHSEAQLAWVQVHCAYDGRLTAIVGDNGVGGADPTAGGGLRGVERRLAAFDGLLAVTSPPGGPTNVSMELPCASSSPRT